LLHARKEKLGTILAAKMMLEDKHYFKQNGCQVRLYTHIKFPGTTDLVLMPITVLYYIWGT
jgi:hypothetical protein